MMKKEKGKCGHWSRLFPSETSLLWPQRLPAAYPPTASSGATALTCPGGSLTSAWFLASPASSSSFDPTSPSWLLSGKPLVLSGAAGKTLARLSRPVSSCVYFLGIVAAGTLGQSWTLGPGRASTPQAPGETIFFCFSSALQWDQCTAVRTRSEISSVTPEWQ